MKKLMFVVAALAAGFVVADGITSANVVGYQTLNNGQMTVMLGNQFVDVGDGASGVKLSDLRGNFTDFDLIEFTSCDAEGVVSSSSFTYFTLDITGLEDGWYNEDPAPAGEERIPAGTAVWFTSNEAKPVTIAGQVYQGTDGSFTHTFNAAVEMVCSAFPVAFNPNNTAQVSWNGLSDFDLIEVASCDDEGVVTSTSYTYFTLDVTGLDDGWYNSDPVLVDAPIAIAGQGFWLTMANPSDVTMTEYSPIQ